MALGTFFAISGHLKLFNPSRHATLARTLQDAGVRGRIDGWMPINRADWIGDVLYLPEALYCIGLAVVMMAGPGPWSLDALITPLLST